MEEEEEASWILAQEDEEEEEASWILAQEDEEEEAALGQVEEDEEAARSSRNQKRALRLQQENIVEIFDPGVRIPIEDTILATWIQLNVFRSFEAPLPKLTVHVNHEDFAEGCYLAAALLLIAAIVLTHRRTFEVRGATDQRRREKRRNCCRALGRHPCQHSPRLHRPCMAGLADQIDGSVYCSASYALDWRVVF